MRTIQNNQPAKTAGRGDLKKRKHEERDSGKNDNADNIKRKKLENGTEKYPKSASGILEGSHQRDGKNVSKEHTSKVRTKHKLENRELNTEGLGAKVKKSDDEYRGNKRTHVKKAAIPISSSSKSKEMPSTNQKAIPQNKPGSSLPSANELPGKKAVNKKKKLLKESESKDKDSKKVKQPASKTKLEKRDKKKKGGHPTKNKKEHHSVKESSASSATSTGVSDPMALLMMMEGQIGKTATAPRQVNDQPSTSSGQTSSLKTQMKYDSEHAVMTDSESEGMSDWEEVHDHHIPAERSQIPDKPVEITVEMPEILKHKKRKKKTFDWKAYLARRVKRFKKEVAIDMHKVHLLCLVSLGMRQNETLNDTVLEATILSLLPAQFTVKTKLSEERRVENLLLWYKRKFSLENISNCSSTKLVSTSSLCHCLASGSITDARIWVLIFVSSLRAVGLTVRLVLSFQPMPFKVPLDLDGKAGAGKGKGSHKNTKQKGKGGPSKSSTKRPSSGKSTPSSKSSSNSKKSSSKKEKPPPPKRRPSERESSIKATMKTKNALKSLGDNEYDDDADDDYSDVDAKKGGHTDVSDSELSEMEKKKIDEIKKKQRQRQESDSDTDFSSSEAEFEESSTYFGRPDTLRKNLKILSNRKALSSDSSSDEIEAEPVPVGHDFWLEVYFPDKQKWVCFDCFKSQFGKPYSLENSATQPLTYVLGFKNDGSVKDVTARYSKKWLSHTRKERVDQEWWMQTLLFFDKTPYKEILMEDDEIKGQLLVRPMPTSIGEFKSHPLYALRRHLLKFEALYPDTAIPLGYIKKEPIYARECVHTLHSRDNWLKEGRLVRLNEQPYKMVKSRPKWNKPKENPDELDLELYGLWQTEEYIPPPAVNGKVPKNEYGNVELFKPWMLPKGTVQIRGQSMQRVAKKLSIDIAPAMIGWDHHSGYAHPVMDGWVVCEEFADTLLAAWEEDQEIQRQREVEKREKRVYGNWRLLIRGLLIKERLKNKFLQGTTQVEKVKKEKKICEGEEAADVQLSWPQIKKEAIQLEKTKAAQTAAKRNKKLLEKGTDVDSRPDQEITLKTENTEIESVIKKEAKPVIQSDLSGPKKKGGGNGNTDSNKTVSSRKTKKAKAAENAEKPARGTKRAANKDQEDSDFEMSASQIKHSQEFNKRIRKSSDEEERVAGELGSEKSSSKQKTTAEASESPDVRTRRPRQAKQNLKFVAEDSDASSENERDDDHADSDYDVSEDVNDDSIKRSDSNTTQAPKKVNSIVNSGAKNVRRGADSLIENNVDKQPWKRALPIEGNLNLSEDDDSDEEDSDDVIKKPDMNHQMEQKVDIPVLVNGNSDESSDNKADEKQGPSTTGQELNGDVGDDDEKTGKKRRGDATKRKGVKGQRAQNRRDCAVFGDISGQKEEQNEQREKKVDDIKAGKRTRSSKRLAK